MKKMLAWLLAVSMLLGLSSAAWAAGEGHIGTDAASSIRVEEANELSSSDRLEALRRVTGEKAVTPAPYGEDELVTVIVQLAAPAVLEDYGTRPAGEVDLMGTATPGEAVSAYLTSPEAQARSQALLEEQDALLGEIAALGQSGEVSLMSALQPEGRWTYAINAMAVRVPYGRLAAIRALDGVKNAYVQHTYSVPEPVMEGAGTAGFSYDMVGLQEAWEASYTGKGMVVAVADTGLDLRYDSFWDDGENDNVTAIRHTHEAFREDSFQSEEPAEFVRYTQEGMTAFLAAHPLHAHDLTRGDAVNSAAFKNLKVPYAFDYAGDTDENGDVISGDVNVWPGENGSNHGTHVAGTVAGYAETGEGEVTFSGVAPDAQLIILKVFQDDSAGGATNSSIFNAIEDALVLGADVINLSLGSDNGFADDDTTQVDLYRRVEEAGVILMTSAGNSNTSSAGNIRGDYNLTANPENTMMSAPAVYPSNLSVASINNSVDSFSTLVWNDGTADHTIRFSDPYTVAIKTDFSAEKLQERYPEGLELIPVGEGTVADYQRIGFSSGYYGGRTGIALVKRGGVNEKGEPLTFAEKVKNASDFTTVNSQGLRQGVVAVFIYDSDPAADELINISVDGSALDSAFITGKAGAEILAAIEAASAAGDGTKVTLKGANQADELTEWDQAGEMSEFTSWGAGPALELKPEITAPGGNIWSALFDQAYNHDTAGYHNDYTGSYGMMSGTSMAAPHMSGLAALVRQYVQGTGKATGAAAGDLTNQLLVSTALPQKQTEAGTDTDAYYSPRRQGAGLVNVGAAIKTPAYITVEGKLVGKLELGDDKDWTGEYPIVFTLNNLTDEAVTYTAAATLQRPATATEGGADFMLESDVLIGTADLGTVTVPAGGSVTVEKSVSLTAEQIAGLKDLFPNGTYIEGFVILTNASETVPQIGLPYLAFLGDWTAAPIFDSATWIDRAPEGWDPETDGIVDEETGEVIPWNPWDYGDYTWFPSLLGSTVVGADGTVNNWMNLGQNPFDPLAETDQKVYYGGNLTLSPDGNGYLDDIDDVELYQLRDAKMMVVQVRDAETGALYYRDFASYNTKTLYSSAAEAAIPTSIYYFTSENWAGTDLEGNRLPSGTRCIYTITAYGEGDYGDKTTNEDLADYPITDFWAVDPTDPDTEPTFNGHPMDKTGDVLSFPIVVDYAAPKLVNNAVSVVEEDGKVYLVGTVSDVDGAIASLEIVPMVNRTPKEEYLHGSPAITETGPDMINPFHSEFVYDEGVKELSFKVDVTSYAHTNESKDEYGYSTDYQYDWEWTGYVRLYCGDYGANDRAYSIRVKDMAQPGQILLSQNSAQLHVGNEFELGVIDNSDADRPLTRTSSKPEVATVDEFGKVVAVAPGQTVITVSNGVSSAVCVVAVEEYPTEVIDFDLSIRDFKGLQAGVPITVEVTNLQPADVVIDPERSSWLVYEDDEEWAGLVNVYRNSEDGLSGQIELMFRSSQDEIPNGTGYLDVTLNGHTERMTFSWEDVPASSDEDYLVSAAQYNEQTIYVPYGERAILVAKYNKSSLHNALPVKLYSPQGAENYSSSNPREESVGLVLDGPGFVGSGAQWQGKLVNQEGYALPESIQVGYSYPYYDGGNFECWWTNSEYSTYYTYDSATGEISVPYAPYGSENTLVIRADGVVSEGAPAGTLSGDTWEMPDGIYGPFDWAMTEGMEGVPGELEAFEDGLLTDNYSRGNGAYFTPSAPGVSYITASSKDGKYSVNFAVVCQPQKAEQMTLEPYSITMQAGETRTLEPVLTPEPTLDEDKELLWLSYDPSVVSVAEDGTLTAVRAGYALIRASVKHDTDVQAVCLVKVEGTTASLVPTHPMITPDKPDTPEIRENEDGTTTTVVTAPDGTVTETTEKLDGSTEVVEIKPDGTVTETVTDPEGATTEKVTTPDEAVTITVTDKDGEEVAKVELPAALPTADWRFDDVSETHWADKAIHGMAALEVVNGTGDNKYSPVLAMDRASLATVLFRMSHGKSDVESVFEDVESGQWYAEAVAWAAKANVVKGISETEFAPQQIITREQLATMLCRYANLLGVDVTADKAGLDAFPDGAKTSSWAADGLAWCVKAGVIKGTDTGALNPTADVSRAEVAVMLERFIGLLKK